MIAGTNGADIMGQGPAMYQMGFQLGQQRSPVSGIGDMIRQVMAKAQGTQDKFFEGGMDLLNKATIQDMANKNAIAVAGAALPSATQVEELRSDAAKPMTKTVNGVVYNRTIDYDPKARQNTFKWTAAPLINPVNIQRAEMMKQWAEEDAAAEAAKSKGGKGIPTAQGAGIPQGTAIAPFGTQSSAPVSALSPERAAALAELKSILSGV